DRDRPGRERARRAGAASSYDGRRGGRPGAARQRGVRDGHPRDVLRGRARGGRARPRARPARRRRGRPRARVHAAARARGRARGAGHGRGGRGVARRMDARRHGAARAGAARRSTRADRQRRHRDGDRRGPPHLRPRPPRRRQRAGLPRARRQRRPLLPGDAGADPWAAQLGRRAGGVGGERGPRAAPAPHRGVRRRGGACLRRAAPGPSRAVLPLPRPPL
ncbi:MAG: Spermidine synthase, partial [uncultured Nocardioides sp.]